VSRSSLPIIPLGALAVAAALGLLLSPGCGDGAASGTSPGPGILAPQPLGATCRTAADCLSGVCLKSEYGTPFCTRACTAEWEPCSAGADAAAGQALCVSFTALPNPSTGPFRGDLSKFCVPRCATMSDCRGLSDAWETCDVPRYLGDPLYPALGQIRVCQAPSYQGKDPVDPAICDWEKTVASRFQNEANTCRSYCAYLDRCKELPPFADLRCCEWGCFNRMIVEGEVHRPWFDEVRCFLDYHAAFPTTGPVNACNEPPRQCGGDPDDPTPAAARL